MTVARDNYEMRLAGLLRFRDTTAAYPRPNQLAHDEIARQLAQIDAVLRVFEYSRAGFEATIPEASKHIDDSTTLNGVRDRLTRDRGTIANLLASLNAEGTDTEPT